MFLVGMHWLQSRASTATNDSLPTRKLKDMFARALDSFAAVGWGVYQAPIAAALTEPRDEEREDFGFYLMLTDYAGWREGANGLWRLSFPIVVNSDKYTSNICHGYHLMDFLFR